jgi:integrase
MVMVELKGLHIVRAGGRVYAYAWRGGPRIKAALGTPQFIEEYNRVVEAHRLPDTGTFRSVVSMYKASDDYKRLADTTRRNWARWLDRIAAHFGDLSIRQFDRPEKIRPLIRRWRGTYASQPRTADYGMQVLSRVLSFAVDPLGKIASNPCEGIKQLYANNRAEIIWTPSDIAQLSAVASSEVMRAVDLAAATGLRVSDLLRLSWSHVQDDAIIISTGKSRHRREAIIPLYDDLATLLKSIDKKSTAVLVNSRGRPWTADGLNSSFATAMKKAKLKDRDLHFHDLRGTAATRFYLAGLSERVIAEIMGWEEDQVAKIIRRYVDRKAALKAAIHQLSETRVGTGSVK